MIGRVCTIILLFIWTLALFIFLLSGDDNFGKAFYMLILSAIFTALISYILILKNLI